MAEVISGRRVQIPRLASLARDDRALASLARDDRALASLVRDDRQALRSREMTGTAVRCLGRAPMVKGRRSAGFPPQFFDTAHRRDATGDERRSSDDDDDRDAGRGALRRRVVVGRWEWWSGYADFAGDARAARRAAARARVGAPAILA